MSSDEILLCDISGIFHPAWAMRDGKDTNFPYQATVDRVRQLANGHDHVGICFDSPKSFRKEIDPSYKANREKKEAAFYDQFARVKETLAADGYAIFEADGFEADDLLATLTKWATSQTPPRDVLLATSDKDLLALLGDHVEAWSLTKSERMDDTDVLAKFGVTPSQITDYLCLVGDASDAIKGIPGVGPKRAAELLGRFGSLANIFRSIAGKTAEQCGLTPAIYKALSEGIETAELARKLVTLRTDAPVDCAKVLEPRVVKPLAAVTEDEELEDEQEETVETIDEQTGEVVEDPKVFPAITPMAREIKPAQPSVAKAEPSTSMAIVQPPSWDLALEPTSAGGAFTMAKHIFNSRMFPNMPNAEAVFSVILMGRTLGVDSLTMLRNVHLIEGKITLYATLIIGLVLKSGQADYFKCVESTNEKAIYKTHRKGDPDPEATVFEYTIEDAKRQQLLMPLEPGKKPSNWHKIPRVMLRHRCSTELARAVFPDITSGLYCPDEFPAGAHVNVGEEAA